MNEEVKSLVSNLVREIEAENGLSAANKEQLRVLENGYLYEVVEIAKHGLPYRRVESSRRIHNCNGCNHDDRVGYMTSDGTTIKACKIVSYDRGDRGDLAEGNELEYHELWITPDGKFFKTVRTGHQSHWQNEWWSWDRVGYQLLDDPLEQFAFSDILKGAIDALRERLKELKTKTKSQTERLERIQALKVQTE